MNKLNKIIGIVLLTIALGEFGIYLEGYSYIQELKENVCVRILK